MTQNASKKGMLMYVSMLLWGDVSSWGVFFKAGQTACSE